MYPQSARRLRNGPVDVPWRPRPRNQRFDASCPVRAKGDSTAQANLGTVYYHHQAHAEAAKWWSKAAEQGNADAQQKLGRSYSTGDGVAQDYAEAVRWFRKAADQDDADAQFNLGSQCYYGQGLPQDYTEAVKWWRKAADAGNVAAQRNLGIASYYGRGVAQTTPKPRAGFAQPRIREMPTPRPASAMRTM